MAPVNSAKKSNKMGGKKALGAKADSKSRVSKSKGVKRPAPQQQKSKPAAAHAAANKKKQRRVYTDAELGIPKLNMITPTGVEKPKGKKKGKVFVDDPESMMTIMAMVNAEKEGQIESKMMRARQMEEIREARRREQERKEEERKGKLENVKDGLRKKRRRKDKDADGLPDSSDAAAATSIHAKQKMKKRVSFG